jgi:hypothetical protein
MKKFLLVLTVTTTLVSCDQGFRISGISAVHPNPLPVEQVVAINVEKSTPCTQKEVAESTPKSWKHYHKKNYE